MSNPIQPAASQPTLATIAEQLTQMSTRLDLLDEDIDLRFNALSHQIFCGQLAGALHIHRTRSSVADLEQNMYRRQHNSNITNPVDGLLVPLCATGGEVDLGNGRWGFHGPGVTRQSIEDTTDDEIDDLLRRIGVRGVWPSNRKTFLRSVLGV